MIAKTARSAVIGVFAVICSLAFPVSAEENDGAKKCIHINRISSVRVIDNQHIRFKMSGGTDYLNTLPHTCPGLGKHTPIMYKTSLNQLCDLDTVTVLNSIGGGFMRGASCGLGKFVPLTEDE